jgi:predicted enzyme related to lactoylglutathione lyase
MDPVIHFEIPVVDTARAEAFYRHAFGWQTFPLGPEAGSFVMAFTADSDESTRIPIVRGAINGGFVPRRDPEQGIQITILVENIRETIERIEASGGDVIAEPYELPGVGLFAAVRDTEGNTVQINQDFVVKRLPRD